MLSKKVPVSAPEEALQLRKNIVEWLKDYLIDSKKKGYVLGLSGGIDSAALALLAKEATESVGKDLLALILPIDNDYYDEATAISICERYNIKYKKIDLASNFNELKITLKNSVDKPVIYTNLKARLRECAIYFHANNLDYIVLGTVNKGEYAIGYFPKNASAGDILPNVDLLKREIREIGKSYGLKDEIVNRKASGCIWAETAEEEWGFTEEELDLMTDNFDENEDSLKNLKEIAPEKIERFISLYRTSAHKRKFYPIFRKRNSDATN